MRAFEGTKILDCTHVLAAPFATYLLAVLGADVIKVEDPNEPDQSRSNGSDKALKNAMMGASFLAQGSNKRAIALNLKTESGQEILKRLAANWADVLVENFRPGAFKALGLGYDHLSQLNPKLIYASMSAFGQDGPRGTHTGYDSLIAATSGIMASTGTETSGPIRCPVPMIDYATGMVSAYAISAALYQRSRTGEGQYIDMAMLDVALMLQSSPITNYLQSGHFAQRGDLEHFASGRAYQTKDGLVQLAAMNLGQQRRFYEAIDMPEAAARPKKEDHLTHFDAELEMVAKKMKEKTADEWEAYLQARHVPAARVRETREMLTDQQLKSRRVLHRHESIPGASTAVSVPLAPFKFAHDGPSIERRPPSVGEHTDEVLAIIGYGADEIAAMRKSGAIG